MAVIGLIGLIASPLAELLIAKLLPRVGPMPGRGARITTAAITGALSGAFALRFGADPALPAFLLFVILGVQLARIDISLHLLPNPLVLLLLTGCLFLLLGAAFSGEQWSSLARALGGAAILFATYLILALISPAGMGMGDVKLAAPIGLYLGYLGWSQLLYGGLLGFILNGVIALLVVRRTRVERPSEVPHGPSMLASAVGIALFFG
ncbi:prepilin peptidase [Pseudarthrobacter sp. AL07]|uniref:prepilin peptidase n=1 Tax=unclassified Pseudarthrobacter TaxID=2647000 RepID=UPI00249AE878|nr:MULTISPECIES: prepilin peptidase [unclassified Pseudarthrobacter]MDI3193777.1 prepilin peptidase [Pseudarthrobacter sp. AL20]MDI3207713.1 prepilin peptidase [Pseudarthrobacter sp. AL07]